MVYRNCLNGRDSGPYLDSVGLHGFGCAEGSGFHRALHAAQQDTRREALADHS